MVLGSAVLMFPVQALEGVARLKSKVRYGRAEPCLTTVDKANQYAYGHWITLLLDFSLAGEEIN
jgi:hypothetical protein